MTEKGTSSRDEIIEERKEKALIFLKSKLSWIFYLVLALIVWINWKIRTIPMPKLIDVTTGGYTLGPDLDPFLFLRYAKYIVEHGSMMAWDYTRYVPLGFNSAVETKLLPYMMAYFHKFLAFFSSTPSVEYSSALFPAFISIFTAIACFLLVRRIFRAKGEKISNIIALASTAFLVVLPSLLPRTIAGIPEKESVGFFLIFLGFYFFIAGWQSQKTRNAIIFGILAGISTGAMGLIWGGVVYMFTTIAIATFIAFIFNKVGKNQFLMYCSCLAFTIILMVPLSARYTITGLATSTSSGLNFAVFFILLVDFILFKTKLKDSKIVNRIREINRIQLSERILSIIISAIIILLIVVVWFGPKFVFNFFGDIVEHLTTPYTDRLGFTVAENRQPFFAGEWRDSFGPVIKDIPLFFWLFFIGSIFLFYEMIKSLELKNRLILVSTYALFLFALIFSKYAPNGAFDGTSGMSKLLYFGGILLFGGVFVYIYYKYMKENKLSQFEEFDFGYIFIIAYFVISLMAARSAIRLIMGLAPVAAIIISYFVVTRAHEATKKKEDTMKLLSISIAILVVLAAIYTFWTYYNISKNTAENYIPDRYRIQWQKAMGWVRDNTPKDAVFSHWWDYGYWVQSMGERATVLDGGNAIAYWDHLMGRHVLCANSENEALEFMYTHNSTYLLIDPTEIGKYGAYSSIGSDENYDKYSWIAPFLMDEKNIQEKRNETVYYYQSGTLLDEDYVYETNTSKIIFPARKAIVGYMILTRTIQGEFKQPEVVFFYQNKPTTIPLRYLYYNNTLVDFKSGYNGTMYLMQRLIQDSNGMRLSDIGASLFLSARNTRALWVRMYLLGEGTNLKLVHSETNPVVASLRQNNLNVNDFIFFSDVEGPIKIWKAEFPASIKANPDYLKTEYPNQVLSQARVF